jgi:hypothetical protein
LAIIAPFGEALLCNRGYKAIGGHAIYDASIAIGVLITELSAASDQPTSQASVQKKVH